MNIKHFLHGIIWLFFIVAVIIALVGDSSGQTWAQQSSGTTILLHSVYFIDIQKGFSVGDLGTIRYTTNAGTAWAQLISGTSSNLRIVSFDGGAMIYTAGKDGINKNEI